MLRLSFAVRGKQDPPGFRAKIVEQMRGAGRPAELDAYLRRELSEALAASPPAPPGSGLTDILSDALAMAPGAIGIVQNFLDQWHLMKSLTLEIRRLDEQWIASATFEVEPGREIRLARLFLMQPAILLRGRCRVTIQPKHEGRNEHAVLFEPAGDGGAEIRFEGLGYALVRMSGLPLADGKLREIRLTMARAPSGPDHINIALVMQAGGSGDPRRLMAFRQVRPRRTAPRPGTRAAPAPKQLVFTYVTPAGRYVWRLDRSAD
jgi:hypothetical protein